MSADLDQAGLSHECGHCIVLVVTVFNHDSSGCTKGSAWNERSIDVESVGTTIEGQPRLMLRYLRGESVDLG